MRGRIEFEEHKIQNNMSSESNKQGIAHDYLHEQMRLLDIETDTANAKSMALDRRIEEIERMIVVRACVDEITGKSLI